MSAKSIWRISEAEFPSNAPAREKLGFALKYAALAPTESHWPQWEFRLADTCLELIARNDPALETDDPDGREVMIGCGAALLHLKLALKHFGCLGRVALFPDLGEPALVARIHAGCCQERDPQENLLFKAMTGSRAIGSLLGGTPVSETVLAAMSSAVAGERGWLDFVQSETSRHYVLKITEQAPRWSQPPAVFGGRAADSWNGEPVPQPSVPAPTLAVVKTKTDDKHGWVAAGLTMARTVLKAQSLGLSWAFFDPVRHRETRSALRLGVGHKGFAQVILRFASLTTDETIQLAAPTTATAIFR